MAAIALDANAGARWRMAAVFPDSKCQTLKASDCSPRNTILTPSPFNPHDTQNPSSMPAFDLSYPGAYIVVVTITAIIWSLLVLGIRLFLRLKVNGPLSWDDGCCIGATILACMHSVLTLLQLRYGLARPAGTQPQTTINWSSFLLWLSGYFYYMAQALSMLSVCFLLARIVRHRKMAWGCYGIAVATAAWAIAGMATTAFECELPRPWERHDAGAKCIDLVNFIWRTRGRFEVRCQSIMLMRHLFIQWAMNSSLVITRALLETANILMASIDISFFASSLEGPGSAADDDRYQSVIMLWSLNMHLAPKLQTIAAFSMRLLDDWPRARVPAVILGQVVIHLSVILTTVPCAKPFLRIFDSGSLHLDPNFAKKLSLLSIKRKRSDGNNSQSTEGPNDTLDRHAGGGSGGGGGTWRRAARWDRILLRPDHSSNITTIKHDPESSRSGGQSQEAGRRASFQTSESSRRVITRTDSFHVSYEAALPYPEPTRKKSKDTTVSFELDVLTK
ncbi:hypothetical protein KC336_g19716 [Hortaea werneckii]|nr:hypothetical protein KC336_g19716 [Hortaea werneckii]